MLKKLLPVFSIAVLLATAGFGCKGLSKDQQQAMRPVTVEYWTVFDDVDALQSLLAKYRADRPYVSVNLRQISSEEFNSRLLEALAEDKGPDIISIRNRWVKNYQSKLATMPASVKDTVVRVEKTTLGTNTVVKSSDVILPTALQIDREYVSAVKNDVIVNGKIYGLPLSLDTMALYYNKDLFDKAGIPEPPKNWEEFQSAAKKLTKYDKKTGKILQFGAALGTGKNIAGFDDL
ncbi:MAG: extracellular solute-binding protein, partial [Patescibacteria group bacterium]